MTYPEKMFVMGLKKTEFSPIGAQMLALYKKACKTSHLGKGVLFLRKIRMDLLSHSHILEPHGLYALILIM